MRPPALRPVRPLAVAAAVLGTALALLPAAAEQSAELKRQNLTQLITDAQMIVAGKVLRVVDGITPSGTVISGQGTPVLHLSNLSEGDAGRYDLYFESQCVWQGNYLIVLTDCAPPCPADFNQDGGVDGSDVAAFFSAWENGDASADVNQDGGVDGSDIDPFFFAWENGGC